MIYRSVSFAMCALAGVAVLGASLHMRADYARDRDLRAEITALRAAVATAKGERDALVEQSKRLEAALAAASPPPIARSIAPSPAASVVAGTGAPDADPPRTPAHGASPRGVLGSLDADRLVAAGFSRQDVERFRERVDEIEMKRLYLRDQATREGWIDTPRFARESQALLDELVGLRTELDEPLYDWVLYSTGHPNRVAVRDVIEGSAGESAGLLRGDVIVRYDDRLMLSAQELRDATLEGRAGELVAVEVQREGESATLRVFVPRGPIGVTLAPAALEPPPAG